MLRIPEYEMKQPQEQRVESLLRRSLLQGAVRSIEAVAKHCTEANGYAAENRVLKGALVDIESAFEDVIGRCVGCECCLIIGEQGYSYEGGEVSCEECSPTWEDAKAEWLVEGQDEEDRKRFLDDYNSFVAAGGDPSDKPLRTL